ncbi:MAG: hypothetical protein M3P33_00290 [bacterium]|nr:hypothetical protein [bacterium]
MSTLLLLTFVNNVFAADPPPGYDARIVSCVLGGGGTPVCPLSSIGIIDVCERVVPGESSVECRVFYPIGTDFGENLPPPISSGVSCVPDWENATAVEGVTGHLNIPSKYMDTKSVSNINFSWPMPSDRDPNDPGSVDFSIATRINSTIYTSIFGNYMNLLTAYVGIPAEEIKTTLNDPAKAADFDLFGCVYGANDTAKGSVQLTVNSSFTYIGLEEEGFEENCDYDPTYGTPNDPAAITCRAGLEPIMPCSDPLPEEPTQVKCNFIQRRLTPKQYTGPEQTNQNTSDWPHMSRSLREIGIKTASIIKDQWCDSSGGNTSCLEGYTCKKVDENSQEYKTMKIDASANGKDGKCTLESDTGITNATTIKKLCSQTTAFVPDQLSSKVCIYSGGYKFTDPINLSSGDFDPSCTTPECKDNLPIVSDGQISSGDNQIPFDTALFQDRGEYANDNCRSNDPDKIAECSIDGYYRRIISRVGQYTPEEYTIMENIMVKTDLNHKLEPFELEVVEAQPGEIANKWIFDFIEKLGGYYELSNDMRFTAMDLLPSGYAVVRDNENLAYLRGVNAMGRGYMFINGRMAAGLDIENGVVSATGKERIKDIQGAPFLSSQRGKIGFVVAFSTYSDKYSVSSSYIYAKNDAGRTYLMRIPGTEGSYVGESVKAFMNSKNEVVVFATARKPGGGFATNKTYYKILTAEGFSNEWIPLDEDVSMIADFAIDNNNGIHVLGSPGHADGALSTYWDEDKLYYHRYLFSNGNLTKEKSTVVSLAHANKVYKTILKKPFSIQADMTTCNTRCGADIVVSVLADGTDEAHKYDSEILYLHINPEGMNDIKELAVKIEGAHINYRNAAAGRDNVIISLQGKGANVLTTGNVKYIVYQTNFYTRPRNDGGAAESIRQIHFSRKVGSSGWSQDRAVTSPVYASIDQTKMNTNEPKGKYGFSLGSVDNATIGADGSLSLTLVDTLTKYNTKTRTYDSAGFKRCMLDPIAWMSVGNSYCGLVENRVTKYVVPPTQSSNGKIEFIDAIIPDVTKVN